MRGVARNDGWRRRKRERRDNVVWAAKAKRRKGKIDKREMGGNEKERES